MGKYHWLILFLVVGIIFSGMMPSRPLQAAPSEQALFQGPLVATDSPEQDGFWIVDLGTGSERFLSFGDGAHYFGGFSPNGCEFVFTWERDGLNADLYAARLDGSQVRQLMTLGSSGALNYRVWAPQWSPSGDRILFTLIRYYDPPDEGPYRQTHIALVSTSGGMPTIYSNRGQETQPQWSPDGSRLVYVSDQGDAEQSKRELWVGRADGSDRRRLTDFGSGEAFTPRWSPNGEKIAYVYAATDNVHQLMIVASTGGSTQSLYTSGVTLLDYDWQADSKSIVASLMGFQGVANNTLWLFSLDNPATPIYMFPTVVPNYFDFPRFSADGRWLAFRQTYQLTLYDWQTSTLQVYPATFSNNSAPVWSSVGFIGEEACLN